MTESPTFEIPGPDGKGIPEGTYKISLIAMVPQAQIRTIETLVIDLAKPNSK